MKIIAAATIKPLARIGSLWLAIRVFCIFLANTIRGLFGDLFLREGGGPINETPNTSPTVRIMWHRWFAWHPIYVDDGYFCWGMRYVWRAGMKIDGKWIMRMYSSRKPVK